VRLVVPPARRTRGVLQEHAYSAAPQFYRVPASGERGGLFVVRQLIYSLATDGSGLGGAMQDGVVLPPSFQPKQQATDDDDSWSDESFESSSSSSSSSSSDQGRNSNGDGIEAAAAAAAAATNSMGGGNGGGGSSGGDGGGGGGGSSSPSPPTDFPEVAAAVQVTLAILCGICGSSLYRLAGLGSEHIVAVSLLPPAATGCN
jgi:hypothetical protein